MRLILLLILIGATATPAAAQDITDPQRDGGFWMQQELDRQHAISQDNQLMSLEAQLRTEQTLRQLEAQRSRPILPQPVTPAAPASASTSKVSPYASIPDDRLAASNARVRAVLGH
jgi:hypothetical protein